MATSGISTSTRSATPERALPVGAVLTIPAAGSESSQASVVTNEDGWLKRDIAAECLIPRFAVMNPEFTFTLPAYQTACGASDILAHMMERYFTRVQHVDLTRPPARGRDAHDPQQRAHSA